MYRKNVLTAELAREGRGAPGRKRQSHGHQAGVQGYHAEDIDEGSVSVSQGDEDIALRKGISKFTGRAMQIYLT